MGVFNVPKALYKAQQAKNQMSKLKAAGQQGPVGILVNGLNEIVEVEIDVDSLSAMFEDSIPRNTLEKIANILSQSTKKAFADAKKQIEQELIKSTSLDDLKDLLG